MALYNPTIEKIINAINGLTLNSNKEVELGGSLTKDTLIEGTTQSISIKSNLAEGPDFNYVIGIGGDFEDKGTGALGLQVIDNLTGNEGKIQINEQFDLLLESVDTSNRSAIEIQTDLISLDSDVLIDLVSPSIVLNPLQNNAVTIVGGALSPGVVGDLDYSSNYTNLSYVQKIYVDNAIASVGSSTVTQIHTTGATVTANNDTTALYIDPASPLAALTITLAANPTDGQEVKISFGGTITSGNVITSLTVQGNAGDTILSGSSITQADAGEGYIFKYQESTNLWRQF